MMAKPSDKTVHLAKSITEAIQIGRVSLLSRGYALLAVKLDLEAVMNHTETPPQPYPDCPHATFLGPRGTLLVGNY